MKHKAFSMHYHMMLLPGMIFLLIFNVVPMFGVVIAFQNFKLGKGIMHSEWVGFENFLYMFQLPDSKTILFNTVFIALMKIVAHLIIPLTFALLLNELRLVMLKRWIQTIVYLPHFLSWVILSSIVVDLLSLNGVVNKLSSLFGIKPIMFLASNDWFPFIVVGSDVWKDFGFGAIVYLAALTGINPQLYEAAEIDGASRWQKLFFITLPGIRTTVILLATLSLGNILNAGFDQIFNLYNPIVYQSGDIIDTYVYRVGLIEAQYGLATAVGLMKSFVSLILIVLSYVLASKYANYRIF